MKKKRVTLQDIADLADVSVSTVSRVLNHDEELNILPETRIKIFEIAEELKYKLPKVKHERHNLIAIVSSYDAEEELKDAYYIAARAMLEKELMGNNYAFQHVSVKDLNPDHFSGAIALGIFSPEELDVFDLISIPVVFFDTDTHYRFSSVCTDTQWGSRSALRYLFKKGHRDIGFIGGLDEGVSEDYRYTVYKDMMQKEKLFNEDRVFIGDFETETGYRGLKEIVKRNVNLTAVFVANDSIAIGTYRAAHELGLKIPDDLSIIGYNNSVFSEYLVPSLTTVNIDLKPMAENCINMLERLMKKKSNHRLKILLPPALIIRDSVKKIDE